MNISAEELRLYAVTDRSWAGDFDGLLSQIEAAMDGGAGFFQLREKRLSREEFLAEAQRFVALCHGRGLRCVINDDAEIALASGADGAHVGQEDLLAGSARALLGETAILGVSAHNVEEALRAQAAGADYLGVGAAFATGTKTDARPITHEMICAITAAVTIPVVAIGGVTGENILELSNCGLSGVAVISGLFAQKDVRKAAEELLALSRRIAQA